MKSEPKNPLCHSCIHRGLIPGTHHSRCLHPTPIATVASGMAPSFNPHGVARGWAAWPYNFDPIWLEECDIWELDMTPTGPVMIYVSDFVPPGAAYADPPVPFGKGLEGFCTRRVEEEIAKALLEKTQRGVASMNQCLADKRDSEVGQ